MPDPSLKRTVNFDRDDIRSKLERYTFYEARRQRGPIYEAIVKELYEEGCSHAAKYVKCLSDKENSLIESKSIRLRVSHDVDLLSALVENIELAEKAYNMKECGGFVATFRLLYQCLNLLEPLTDYDWLLCDVYVIISKICHTVEEPTDSTAKMIARIYYRHGIYLSKKISELPRSIKYLQLALGLTRCNRWLLRDNTAQSPEIPQTLHEAVAKQLCKVLLHYAAEVGRNDSTEAAELAQRAVLAIAELGIESNKLHFYNASAERASYLLAGEDKSKALPLLESIYEALKEECDTELKLVHCKCCMSLGIAYSASDSDHLATERFREAVLLCRQFDWQLLEAEVLVNMGKHLSKSLAKTRIAKEAFEVARKIYVKFGKITAVGQTSYLLCKLQAHEIMPYLMLLLKNTTDQFCDFASLRLWKTQVKPFWPSMQEDSEKQLNDEIYCLLTARSEIYTTGIKDPPRPARRRSSRNLRGSIS